MTSEKLPPDAGGLPGPAVGVCLTGSSPEDRLILTGLVRLAAEKGQRKPFTPCPSPPHAHSKGYLFLSQPRFLGGREVAAQPAGVCGNENCLPEAEGVPGTLISVTPLVPLIRTWVLDI